MSGRALTWATAVWEQQPAICVSLEGFVGEVKKVFDATFSGREAAWKIIQLRQDSRSVADYAAESARNQEVLFDVFLHGKKDKTLRLCINERGLNDITVKNRYPLPLISLAFEPLQGATVFSKLDLRNAYHLVWIREVDECKTAFNMASGHYECLVLPFGLTNTHAVFQDLVKDVLRDMLNQFIFVDIDDILVFSRSPQEHVLHVSITGFDLFCPP
eukprot:XP_014071218.1 PREDICTED: RNA-directed DNA polymerase homolog [Salmo salar]